MSFSFCYWQLFRWIWIAQKQAVVLIYFAHWEINQRGPISLDSLWGNELRDILLRVVKVWINSIHAFRESLNHWGIILKFAALSPFLEDINGLRIADSQLFSR